MKITAAVTARLELARELGATQINEAAHDAEQGDTIKPVLRMS